MGEATTAFPPIDYQALFASAPTPFLLLAPDAPRFTVLDANDAYLRAAPGGGRGELVGRAVSDAFPEDPDGAAALRASLERALRTGRADAVAGRGHQLPRPGGGREERWRSLVNTPVLDGTGAVSAILHQVVDVTDQLRAERARRRTEARYRQIVEGAEDFAIVTLDEGGAITGWNTGAERITGWAAAEVLGGPGRVFFAPEDVASGAPEREMARARRHGRAVDERWHRRKDGSRFWGSGLMMRLEGDEPGFLKMFRDRTAEHDAEVALRTLLEGIPQLVWRSCDKGLWTWASPQWLRFTGQTQEEARGRGWLRTVHPDDREATERAWDEARPHGELDVEYRLRRASDGAWIWHHTRSVPVRDGAGRITEWLGTSTDVQQLKELQERQAVLVAELQHRTRNLIGVVGSIADKSARAAADLSDFRDRFGHRMEALSRVQGLLSRLSEGERVTLDEVVRAELAAMDALGDPRVELDGPDGVRLRSGSVQTFALAIHELATNAVKYGALAQPGAKLAIGWRVEPEDARGRPWLALHWCESGVAMPADGPPPGRGQGRELIERALPYQLDARTAYAFAEDGVRCSIRLPISRSDG